MSQRGRSDSETSAAAERSEFGRGVVVCLVKFSEHLANESARRVNVWQWWTGLDDARRIEQQREASRFPKGDAARRLQDVAFGEIMDERDPLDRLIKMWASGAGDHFFDLDCERAPCELRELAELVLEARNVLTARVFGWADWQRIWELWEAATLAVDRQLGVSCDWGQW